MNLPTSADQKVWVCEWCFGPNAVEDCRKQWVCSACLDPRIEAAAILRALPYNSKLRRAALIAESPRVEEYLIIAHASNALQTAAIVRDGKHATESRRKQSWWERTRYRIAGHFYPQTRTYTREVIR